MSSTARPTRTLSPVIALVIAALAVACTGKLPATPPPSGGAAAPSGSAALTPTNVPVDASTDAWLVAGSAGTADLEVIQASNRERFIDLPTGVPDAVWSQLVTTSRVGATTVVRHLAIPELEGASQTLEGAWRLPTVGADPTPVGVSDDRRIVVLVEEGAKAGYGAATTTRFAIVNRTKASKPRIVDLPGAFEYDTLSPNGSVLYVVEHLAGPPDGHYQVRAVDTATGVLRPGVVVDKAQSDEAMAGTPIAQARRPDGMVFTLYHGAEHPFIHALSSVDAWAVCIDLPAIGTNDPTTAADWGLAVTADGRSLVAANATLGLAVEIPFADLAVRRSTTFAPSASGGISLAKFGHQAGGSVGRRVVASPVGAAVYAAGPGGIVRIGTADLAVTGRFLEGVAVDGLAVMPDGRTIYALLHAGGRIVKLDATTGRIIGEVPGGGFDRLVAVVPW
jgi:hypothetical protein